MSMNDRGLTLVEVLAAVVILGILFIGIMSIFPQMTAFNAKTETKLDTMNLARQEMAEIVAADKWKKQLVSSAVTPNTGIPDYLAETKIIAEMGALNYLLEPVSAPESDNLLRFHKKDNYLYEADIYVKCLPFLNPALIGGEEPAPETCSKMEKKKLYKIHLKVFKESETASGTYRLSSETFSFIPYTAYKEETPPSGGG
ncbi:type II secretion system protein [Planococcus sp. ISL-110]|uniref:type IV pilus modification PilV family protein n=1 Tax=Planococcus sp. ISL-110 TaxID=2819167 RepID=UPI001BE6E016|nr:type II secretion system protein [Planococcus sp. ISL-110]MBT2569185.1 type II secretion system protein [Planococcus sp. ISL-110]